MPITIHSLQVRFDVRGSDEKRFAELFTRAMRAWAEQESERRRLEQVAASDRALDHEPGDGVAA